MAENYIVINGKKAELTPEQLKALGIETEINPFEREIGQKYHYIDSIGCVEADLEMDSPCDDNKWEIANYCTDKEMMQQRALHETLNRLLWRYSMEHGGREIDWDNNTQQKFGVVYDNRINTWEVSIHSSICNLGIPYFATGEIAWSAIKEIIEPFMAEHPDFKL